MSSRESSRRAEHAGCRAGSTLSRRAEQGVKQDWLDMTLLDLQESKQAEAAALEQAQLLLEEKQLLEEKLRIHLDIWSMDKKQLEEAFTLAQRDSKSKAIAQDLEIASLNISIGFHHQEALRFKLRLEGALDDVEILTSRLHIFAVQLREKNDKLPDTNQSVKKGKDLNSDPSVTTLSEGVNNNILTEAERVQSHHRVLDELKKKYSMEVERLKSEQCALSSKQKQEVCALIREKNFVWDQFKRMEDDYCSRLNSKGEKLKVAEENLLNVRSRMDELQKAHDEKTVDVTILQINMQEMEEELHQAREELTKLKMAACTVNSEDLGSIMLEKSKVPMPTVSPSGIRITSNRQMGCLDQTGEIPQVKDEELKKKLLFSHSSVSDVTKLVHIKEEELKNTSKMMEELRLENHNLRLMYADLEAHLKGKQKPEKANHNPAKDVTTRNLIDELEAAASIASEGCIKTNQCHVERDVLSRRIKAAQKNILGPAQCDCVKQKSENTRKCEHHLRTAAEVDPTKYQLRSSRHQICNKAAVSVHADAETYTTQLSSFRKKKGRNLLVKSTQSKPPKLETDTKKRKLGPPSPAEALRCCQSRCHTDPPAGGEHKRRKHSSDFSGRNTSLKRGRAASGGDSQNILSPRDPNVEIQKADFQPQDTENASGTGGTSMNRRYKKEQGEVCKEIIERDRNSSRRDSGNSMKHRLFSSVFGIPRVLTARETSTKSPKL